MAQQVTALSKLSGNLNRLTGTQAKVEGENEIPKSCPLSTGVYNAQHAHPHSPLPHLGNSKSFK